MQFFNFNRGSEEHDARYFVIFPDAEEKQAFADTFCGDGMGHMRHPFASATADDLLAAIIMTRKVFIEGWQKRHPRVRLVEAKNLEGSWGDCY